MGKTSQENRRVICCASAYVSKVKRSGPNISPLAGSEMECLAWRYDRLTT